MPPEPVSTARALWHNQERMGFDKYRASFEVSTYGAFVNPRGIVLDIHRGQTLHVPDDCLPEIAIEGRDGNIYSDSMTEWTMRWDDWAESRYMSRKEWREQSGDDYKPYRPGPCSFVLDMDEMIPLEDS